MTKNPASIAVIPARGGSKRLPGKNIKQFFGQPILKYVIDAAKDSGCFDEIMVSTNDREISLVAKHCGAAVPFLRSEENSTDKATIVSALLEVLEQYKQRGQKFDYVCCLFSTAALITPEMLKEASNILRTKKADAVIPFLPYPHPIQRAFRLKNGLIQMIHPENMFKMTQDLEPTFYDTGQFYFMKAVSFIKWKKLFMPKTMPVIVSEDDVVDIDTLEDWKKAETKFLLKEKPPLRQES